MWSANIESRPADNLLGEERFRFLRNPAGARVTTFGQGKYVFLVWLRQLGHINNDCAVYPMLYDERWVTWATRDGDPLALYEFYAGKADPFKPKVPGGRLIGSAITVDAAHAGQGIGRALLQSLYGAGVMIVPSDKMTEAGAHVFNSLAAAGVPVPSPGQITCPWPR